MRFVLALLGALVCLPPGAQAAHYTIQVSLDPAARTADVVMQASGAAQVALAPGLGLQRLRIDGEAVDVAAPRWLLPPGRTVDVAYRVTLPPLEAARRSGLGPFADPEGSFLPLLGWDDQAETFTYDVTIDMPAGQHAVAPGHLVEEREADGRAIARFEFTQPARELPIFAGPYVVGETMYGDLRLRTYFTRETAQLGERYRAQAARYLDGYSAAIGPYPHDSFHVVASPLPVGLAFATLTYVSRQILPLPFMQERSLAHEVLHAWWGLAVAVDYSAGNWAEALTTFMADYALTEAAGAVEAEAMRRRFLVDFAILPQEQDRPVTSFVSRGHAASQVIGYNKGAMLFAMLRDEIGMQAFEAGIRRFWREQQFKVADWDDLRAAFEAEAGRPLDAFFAQWLTRSGAPQLALRGAERTDEGEVAFTLTQAAPAYTLSVPVVIDTAAGPERHTVRLDSPEQAYTLRPAARATALRIDPEYRLFRRLAQAEVPPVIRSIVVAPNAATVAAGADPAVVEAARGIAGRLLEAGARPAGLEETVRAKAPLLLVGTVAEVTAALARAGLPPRPETLAGRGDARIWAGRYGDGVPMLVVEGADAAALAQAGAVIRHYGAMSYLVFNDGRVADRGVFPTATPLQATFVD